MAPKEEAKQVKMFEQDMAEHLADATPEEEEAFRQRLRDRQNRLETVVVQDRQGRKKQIKKNLPSMIRVTSTVPRELADRMRDAMYWLSNPVFEYSLTRFALEAFEIHLAKLARKYAKHSFVKNGRFLPRRGKLKSGRPVHRPGRPQFPRAPKA